MQEVEKDNIIEKSSKFTIDEKYTEHKIFKNSKLNLTQGENSNRIFNFSNNDERKEFDYNNNCKKSILRSNTKEMNDARFFEKNRDNLILKEEEEKIKYERKNFQRSDFKPKTIANCTDYKKFLELKTIPQTSIEKIVKTMNKIKGRLIQYNENDLVQQVEWVIKEILSDNMYKIKIHEKTSKEECDFYNEYSNNISDILLSRDIQNYGKQVMNDSPIEESKPLEAQSLKNLKAAKIEEFGPEFDVFEFAKKNGRENLLLNVSYPIFHYKNINKFINFKKFPDFINQIRIGYTLPPDAFYHNDFHAADVLQTAYYFCNTCKFDEILQLDGIDTLSLYFSALIHDYKHPGFTNTFLIQTFSEISTHYNENHHLAQAFFLIQNNNFNIFDNMKKEFFKILRKRTIECVLSTDMAFHSKIFGQISSKLSYFLESKQDKSLVDFFADQNNSCSKFDLQQEFMNYILHIGDIAHPAKPWNIELKWSELIFKEFFNQGDKEKNMNLPISFLCDRENTLIPKSQIGFIKNIIMPSFSLILSIIPLSEGMNKYIIKNLEKWMLIEEEENMKNNMNLNLNNINGKIINSNFNNNSNESNVMKDEINQNSNNNIQANKNPSEINETKIKDFS